jgi:hypothetical protein
MFGLELVEDYPQNNFLHVVYKIILLLEIFNILVAQFQFIQLVKVEN